MTHQPFVHTFTASGNQSDYTGTLRPSALQSTLLDCAFAHAEQLGLTREFTYQRTGGIWVIIKLAVALDKPILYSTEYTVTTWPRGPQGPYFTRDFVITQDGAPIGRASSQWLITNPRDQKIIRPRDIPEACVALLTDQAVQLPLTKLTAPDKLSAIGSHTVTYSDIDMNHHVNNTRYLDFACDALALHDNKQRVAGYQINYTAQVLAGETVELLAAPLDGGWQYIAGQVDGKTRFELKLALADA